MSPAEVLYRAKCSSCHRLLKRQGYDDKQWSRHIHKYGKRMTAQEKELLLEYLLDKD